MATRIGTPAALAWEIASTVCGRTPSSAATTTIAMSVTRVPRARIALNACTPQCRRSQVFTSTFSKADAWCNVQRMRLLPPVVITQH